MRLGIFGGSFDPVHLGHLILAELCREHAALDEVWFVPAAVPPHKRDQSLAGDKHRVEMLRLAIAGNDRFRVSTMELERGGVSYTVDTLERLQAERPESELFFLMGADSLRELPTWKAPERLCALATPIVVHRGGEPPPDFQVLSGVVPAPRLEAIRRAQFAVPAMEVSSRQLRQCVAEGQTIRYRVPRSVERYLETHQLYR